MARLPLVTNPDTTHAPLVGAVGLADYSREDWERIILTGLDRSVDHDTWEQWRAARDELLGRLRGLGHRVRLVPVEADAYFAWLAERGLSNLSRYRAEYVTDRMESGRA